MKVLTLFVVIAYFSSAVEGACPNFYVEFTYSTKPPMTTCLRFITNVATRSSHKSFCEGQGGNLYVPINSITDDVASYIRSFGSTANHYFVGVEKISPGSTTWISVAGQPMAQSAFSFGTNNNGVQEPDGGTAQNCGCLCQNMFYMCDCFCGLAMYGICQTI